MLCDVSRWDSRLAELIENRLRPHTEDHNQDGKGHDREARAPGLSAEEVMALGTFKRQQ